MKKQTAYALLGGTPTTIARHVGCTASAVKQWPDPLPRRIADRVLAARVRMEWAITRTQSPNSHGLDELVADALTV